MADGARVAAIVASADDVLRAAGTPERAAQERAYLKSTMEHYGVPVPAIRQLAKRISRAELPTREDLLALAERLWAGEVYEHRALAVRLLIANTALLEARDIDLIERFLRGSGTWALVDHLAEKVAGDLLARYGALGARLDAWAADDDFWIRRSALLALLGPLRDGAGDFARFARYADAMLDEQEFFIRKAIGWVLRDTAKKQPEIVYAWLLPRAARASGVTIREAVKYLPAAQRAEVLAAR